ncbi:MAG: pyruvate formate-lyase activating enzyme [Deltaproteobacteria bacterium]|nr:pyruvate formate-lyase activating enzyme [Deltaproteobacteria bacterium]
MSRFLLVDIGAGTMDVLYYDDTTDVHYKAVVRSPVKMAAEKAENLPGDLLVTGCEMGGGPITEILKKRARHRRVVMSVSAALTLHHNLDKVRNWGITIIEDGEIDSYRSMKQFTTLTLGDLDIKRLKKLVEEFGVSFSFNFVGICAQDHGMPPEGLSHLDYRHTLFKEKLDKKPFPHALLYKAKEVPPTLNRLRSIAETARGLPAEEIYLMDSGMAAILGASMDKQALQKKKIIILDVATSHTLAAALCSEEIAGSFEYHTRDVTLEHLDSLIVELADGKLEHKKILEQGGHGAYSRKAFGFKATEAIIATGPKRRLLLQSRLPIHFGAPWGDNMMTGTVGLLEAIRRQENIEPLTYI